MTYNRSMDQNLRRDIQRSILKKDLIDGAYYAGVCRNASIARWKADIECFVHWRIKFGIPSTETIQHPENAADNRLDYFIPFRQLDHIKMEIPLEPGAGRMTMTQRDLYLEWDRDIRLILPDWKSRG